MQVLGIWDGHDAGVAWWRDGRYVCCLSEERLSRHKRQAGFPSNALETLISNEGFVPENINIVAVPGRYGRSPFRIANNRYRAQLKGQNPLSLASTLVRNLDNHVARTHGLRSIESNLGLACVRSRLAAYGLDAPIITVKHHEAHAHTAACAPHRNPLLITMDGYGDGECGRLAPWTNRSVRLRSPKDSIALVYGAITHLLGFNEGDEGKVMGLAAHGDPARFRSIFKALISPGACDVSIKGQNLRSVLMNAPREDVAAALQERTEEVAIHWITSIRKKETTVAVSGGLFANVVLNGRIQKDFDKLYVFPHMGDGGLCVGAVEAVVKRYNFPSVPFLGPSWSRSQIIQALEVSGLSYRECDYPELELAQTIINGGIAARWFGRSAFGPRALGHRSILMRADRPKLVTRLNASLGRDEFMPFAPIRRHGRGSSTMTVVHEAEKELTLKAHAAVHVDGTCRTQIVSQAVDPQLWRLLEHSEGHGLPALINTSFNLHGEPIVESPTDALRTFTAAKLDRLQLGPFLVDSPGH